MLCGFEGPHARRFAAGRSRKISGGFGVGETPLPIPNRAVKPHSADGTWLARAWESRSPPVLSCTSRLSRRLVVVLGCDRRRSTLGVLWAARRALVRQAVRERDRPVSRDECRLD